MGIILYPKFRLKVCYGPATAFQERNYHDYSNDFKEEIIDIKYFKFM